MKTLSLALFVSIAVFPANPMAAQSTMCSDGLWTWQQCNAYVDAALVRYDAGMRACAVTNWNIPTETRELDYHWDRHCFDRLGDTPTVLERVRTDCRIADVCGWPASRHIRR